MGLILICDECKGGDSSGAKAGSSTKGPDERSAKWARAVDFQAGSPEKVKDKLGRELLLESLFAMIDTSGNGTLELDELKKIMKEADTFFNVVNKANPNSISKTEFKSWSYENIVRYLSSENVDRMNKLIKLAKVSRQESVDHDELFAAMDLNGDGSLDLAEIEAVLGGDAKGFLKCLDTVQADGKVEKDEFMRWATGSASEFQELDDAIRSVDKTATNALINLYSMVAVRQRDQAAGAGTTEGEVKPLNLKKELA